MNELSYRNNPKSLFRKYAKLVTWLTKHQLGRDYLGIKDKNIGLLLPNGHHQIEDDISKATFYSRPVFSPKLTPALQRIDVLQNYFFSFDDALKTLFYQTGLIRNPRLVPDVMLADTFNPDADPESTSVDGFTYDDVGGNRTWSNLRGAAGDGAISNGAGGTFAGWTNGSSANTFSIMRRSIFLYDTSSLADGVTVTAADHKVYSHSAADTDGDTPAVVLSESTPASNTNLVAGDYAQVDLTTRLATDIAYGDLNTPDDITHALNASGLSNVSKTGVSKFGITTDNDFDNSAPSCTTLSTEVGRISGKFADNVVTIPRLVVTSSLGIKADRLLIGVGQGTR